MDRTTAGTENPTVSATEVITGDATEPQPPTLRLRLKKKEANDRRVAWREDTVDNEHMNKKKSKCCCIYRKPLSFGESSSEDDEECEHCFGHPEKRKKNKKGDPNGDKGDDDDSHDEHHCHHHNHGDHGGDGGAAGSNHAASAATSG